MKIKIKKIIFSQSLLIFFIFGLFQVQAQNLDLDQNISNINAHINDSINLLINQSLNSSLNHSINVSINDSGDFSNDSINVSINSSIDFSNYSINSSINISINISINVSINISTNVSINISINESNKNDSLILINNSIFHILNHSKNISFGDIFDLNLNIYKGNSRKYVVKSYFEDISDMDKTNIYSKYSNETYNFSLQLINNSNCEYFEGNYTLFIEGLNVSINKSIWINSNCSSLINDSKNLTKSDGNTNKSNENASNNESNDKSDEESDTQSNQKPVTAPIIHRKVLFKLIDFLGNVTVNETFQLKILFEGNELTNNIELFSYIYKHSKTYSGEREKNKQLFTLKPYEKKEIELNNAVLKFGEDLKLKIKVKFNDRVTYDEITQNINVIKSSGNHFNTKNASQSDSNLIDSVDFDKATHEKELQENLNVLAESKIFSESDLPETISEKKDTIYKSKSIKSLDLALYAIIASLIIILSIMLFKKDI
jgi:hypothetical protein